ncbi:MAG: hypothetical protein DRZ90_10050 [Spirochaetes bacterium]|nr:MAG: hypothetical protein DRP49_07950 [Spirochaetota bacterium]RKX95605.1 MAG: hypothetical protein DRZ90_10050 [Spirochaetota bacterium]
MNRWRTVSASELSCCSSSWAAACLPHQTVSKINRESAAMLYNHGLDLIAEGKMQEAGKELLRASEIDIGDADALCEIGRLEIKNGRLDSAAAYLDKALLRDFEHAGALNNRAVVEFLSGHYNEAAGMFRSAVKANPELADAWFNLADCCEEIGDLEGMEEARLRYQALIT